MLELSKKVPQVVDNSGLVGYIRCEKGLDFESGWRIGENIDQLYLLPKRLGLGHDCVCDIVH